MKTAIHNLVSSRQHVSFAEFSRLIEGFDGDVTMSLANDENLIAWHGMSQAAYEALDELLREKRIFMHPASWMTYMIDGLYPQLPRANRQPKGGYKTPHWLPLCFCDYPHDPKATKKRK